MSPRRRPAHDVTRLREALDAERHATSALREQLAAHRIALSEQAGAVDAVRVQLEAMRADLCRAREVEVVCRRFVAALHDVIAVCGLNPEES